MQRWTQLESGEEGVGQVTENVCGSAGERAVWRSLACVPTPKVFPVWGLSKPWWIPGIRCPWVPFCPVSYLLALSPHGLLTSTASFARVCPLHAGGPPCLGYSEPRKLHSARSHHPGGEAEEGEGKTFPGCPQVLASTRAALVATFLLKAVLRSSSKFYLFPYWVIV